jgi:lysophospholipase L1-like esterase
MKLNRYSLGALLVVAMSLDAGAVFAAAPGRQPAPLSHLTHQLNLRNIQPVTITIVGFGSSVGVGATLPDPATQAPVMYLGERLKAAFKSAQKFEVVCDNRSLNGSILSQFLNDVPTGNWNAYLKEGKKPTLVVFAYGMNDGFPAMYNASQPPPFFRSQLVAAIRLVQAAGADPVILTSPHPISTVAWAMPATYNQAYPTAVPAPVGPEQMTPPASRSTVLQDPLGTGRRIPVSLRHLDLNQVMREAARETGCAVIDAERCWFEAVAARGGDAALFNAKETVHPNLLGHQVSYQQAIDAFVVSLAASR